MLKWNAQRQPLSISGPHVDVFADISTRYVTDIQCAIQEKEAFDGDNGAKKVFRQNIVTN